MPAERSGRGKNIDPRIDQSHLPARLGTHPRNHPSSFANEAPHTETSRRPLPSDPLGTMAGGKVKHSELRRAVRDLQHRGLLHSARWAAEQLYGLEDEAPGARDEDEATPAPAPVPATPTAPIDDDASDDEMDLGTDEKPAKPPATAPPADDAPEWRGRGGTPEAAGDDFILAKAYFDLGEYRRASHQVTENRSSLGKFLRYYSLYLAGEKRKNEEMLEVGGSNPQHGGNINGPGGNPGGPSPSAAGGSRGVVGGVGPRPRRDVVNAELETLSFDLELILKDFQ